MKQVQKELEALILNAIESEAFPGANYAVVTKNKVYLGSLGNRELYPNIVNNYINTIYDLASLTKVVCTTSCIMKLIELGLIRLYDKVSLYISRFQFDNITLWHLMTHTSGLPEGIYGPKDKMNNEDVWNKIFNDLTLMFEPGTHISYSDINYILLGKVVEVVSKMKLNEFADKYLFSKLEMNDTMYCPKEIERCAATEYRDDATLRGYVKGSVHDETAYAMGGIAGHAGLFSTVSDLSKFVQMILMDGIYKNQTIFSKATIDELFKVQVREIKGLNLFDKVRCLGWQSKDYGSSAGDLISENSIIHTGFTGTNIFIDRDNEIGFILLTNRVHPSRSNTLHLHYRACFGNYIIAHADEFKEN